MYLLALCKSASLNLIYLLFMNIKTKDMSKAEEMRLWAFGNRLNTFLSTNKCSTNSETAVSTVLRLHRWDLCLISYVFYNFEVFQHKTCKNNVHTPMCMFSVCVQFRCVLWLYVSPALLPLSACTHQLVIRQVPTKAVVTNILEGGGNFYCKIIWNANTSLFAQLLIYVRSGARRILPKSKMKIWSNMCMCAVCYIRSRVQKFPAWHTKAAPNGKCCEGYIVPPMSY